MKTLKAITFTLFIFFSLHLLAQTENPRVEGGLSWYTDLTKANDVSKTSGKPIFALFTGSDWCGWCKKLQREVFAKQEFIDWANKNVVLLELDFPRYKQLSAELKKQNQDLMNHFQVQGFPTVWMFNLAIDEKTKAQSFTPFGSCGYPENPEAGKEQVAFLKDANSILAKKSGK